MDASSNCMARVLRIALASSAVMLTACASLRHDSQAAQTAAAPVSGTSSGATAVRERMRTIAKQHCGSCHEASRPTPNPAALAIYNLDAPDWSATLSAAQLEGGFTRRLNARLGDQDLQTLRAFVAAEVARRR